MKKKRRKISKRTKMKIKKVQKIIVRNRKKIKEKK